MAASHGQLREYILRKKWDRPAGLAGRFLCWGRTDCHVAVLLAMTVFGRWCGAYGAMGASFPTDELEGAAGNGRYFAHENPALVCQRWQRTVGVCRIRCSQLRPRRISLFTPLLADSCGFLHRFQELFYHREFQAHPHQ